MSKWHGGKGSSPRPIDKSKFDSNWDAIFGAKASPCINDCKLNKETQRCVGCERTLEEIAEHGKQSKKRQLRTASGDDGGNINGRVGETGNDIK